ncbi:MAG: TonB-dependent receptor plug domain-containing protein, partial [Rubrivivax sp.]|nr:TonB-dependent receptor plug domain-containing protein [Rubrivivax sp.]
MFRPTLLSRGLMLAFGGSVALATLPALAQDTQRIEVTGSRIKTLASEGASPVTTVSAQDIKIDGAKNVESILNNLPQVFADQNATVSNGASGTASVNLRGLGSDRTLVLVNGRRMPMGSANTSSPDLNAIPTGLIRRVDVLTGGASAVYGSDAVAGVVNFILDDRFEGVEVEFNHGFYNHRQQNAAGIGDIIAAREAVSPQEFKVPGNKSSDGKSTSFGLLMGSNFGNRGNATLYVNYKKDDALLQSERDFSACAVGMGAAGFVCGGSGTAATGRITNLNDGKVWTAADSAGNARLYKGTDAYNYGPTNYFQRPSERWAGRASLNYDITDNARAYANFAFHDDSTTAQVAPGGIFGNIVTVNYDNPLLTDSWRAALGLTNPGDSTDVVVQRRNVEGGGRQSQFRNTSFRTEVGVKGEIGKWSYDVFGISARVIYSQSS